MDDTDKNSTYDVSISHIGLGNAEIIFSLYIPLGENAIVALVDKVRKDARYEVEYTDLYHKLVLSTSKYSIEIRSRGIILARLKSQ